MLPHKVRFHLAGYETIGHPGYVAALQMEAERFGEVARSVAQRNLKIVMVAGPGEEACSLAFD